MTQQTIIAVVDDLMFQSKLEHGVRDLGYAFVAVDTEAGLRDAVSSDIALVVIDLHVRGIDWRAAVAIANEHGVPVLAFGRHTEAQLLRSARKAGCDRVVPRSTFVEELPRLIEELVSSRAT